MIKNKITPLARWTSEEHDFLKQTVLAESTKTKAFNIVSKKTKRTLSGVRDYYRRVVKDELKLTAKAVTKSSPKLSVKTPTIKYHNGVTKNAMIILQNKDLIVAKVDDIVITVEL
jgi:hypothetical protein